MASPVTLAWRQLKRERLRFVVALAGVSFAVILMLMQVGFQDTMFRTAVQLHDRFVTDLVVIHRDSHAMQAIKGFDRMALFQALGNPHVAEVVPVYIGRGPWMSPFDKSNRAIFVIGYSPDEVVLDLPKVNEQASKLRVPETILFDDLSRREFGPVGQAVRDGKAIRTEIAGQRVTVAGLFELGASFSADGTVVTSDETFLRIFGRSPTQIEIGLVRLVPGADAGAVQAALRKTLPELYLVLTKPEFMAKEQTFWKKNTAIGFVFTFGVIIGFVVGAVIVYQILYADVSDHLAEYATLKAMGYTNLYLAGVVLSEAFILSVLGFLPGGLICYRLYQITRKATQLPMEMNPSLALLVLGLTVFMCALSGILAVRKVQSADPADVF